MTVKKMKTKLATTLLLCYVQTIYAQSIDVSVCDVTSRFPITKYIEYFQATTLINIDSVANITDGFKRSKDTTVMAFDYDPFYYWFRIVVSNNTPLPRNQMILMAPVGIVDSKLYQNKCGSWIKIANSGLNYRVKDRSYQSTHHVYPFSLEPQTTDTLYLFINSTNLNKSYGFAMINPKELKLFENSIYFVFGIMVGLLLLFLILNLGLFFVLRERIQLWYSFYIVLLILIIMKNDHLDQQFFGWDSERIFRLTPYMTIGALAIGILTHVVQNFLKPALYQNKILNKLTSILKWNVISSAMVHYLVFNMASESHIHSTVFDWARVSLFLCTILIVVICSYSVIKRFKGGIFVLLGSTVFMIGAIQRIYFPDTFSFLFPPTTFHIGIITETLVISLGFIYRYRLDRREKTKIEQEKLANYLTFQTVLDRTKLEIQEQTTKNISQELHDNIGQLLTLSKLHMNMIDWNDVQGATSKVDDSKNALTKAIQELRDLSKTLNADNISRIGIIEALKSELLNIQKASGIQTKLQAEDNFLHLNPQVELILFRIVQEALHNIIKHSGAKNLLVSLSHHEEQLKLQVQDDGSGFDQNDANLSGSGLTNMKSRCKLINASFLLQSSIGKGTTIFIDLPLGSER